MDPETRSEQEWNRAHLALAVRKIGSEYHSGQSSKGYAKSCQADRVLAMLGFRDGAGGAHEWPEVREMAAAYLWKHRHDVARNW